MIISVTERGTFKRCRQMWDYASYGRQSITSQRPPTALTFGTFVHKIHENWLLTPDEPVEQIVIAAAEVARADLVKQYVDRVGVLPDEQELEPFIDSVVLALDMFKNYEELYGSSLPEEYTLVQPEQTIAVPIPGTDHDCQVCDINGMMFVADSIDDNGQVAAHLEPCSAHPEGYRVVFHYLEGTLDALMQDAAGRLWILERKTYGSKPNEEALEMNDQFLGYLWLLTQLDMGEVGGILYDGMWKRTRETQRGPDRTLDKLFFRRPLIRSVDEIENFTIQLRDEVLDMADPELRIYRNARWEGCWDCQFSNLCLAEFRGEDADHVREQYFMLRERGQSDDVTDDA